MAKLTSIINVVLDDGIVTFDNGIETDFQVPLSMVETNSAHLYRELRRRGWTLDGLQSGYQSQKAEAVAGHIQSVLASLGDVSLTILAIDPIYFIPTEGVQLPDIDPAGSVASTVITGQAAGDGDVGIAVAGGLGGPYLTTPAPADGFQTTATNLAAVIDAGPDYNATTNGGQVLMVDKTPGSAGNAKVISDASTDADQSAGVLVQPHDGHDGGSGPLIGSRAEPSVALAFGSEFFVIPYSWVTGDSASIRRELSKLGFDLAGPGTLISRKSDTLAAHIAASMEQFVA